MGKSLNIFLVEDNDLDVEFLKRGLRKIGAAHSLFRARDGLEAWEVLNQTAPDHQITDPFVILLDINMPRMNGHEFLTALRNSDKLRSARVFVFTTSANPADIDQAYENHVSGYLVKPNSSAELNLALTALTQFWDRCENPASQRL